MKGAIAKAREIAASLENSFIPSQFGRDNPAIHYETTGPEMERNQRLGVSSSARSAPAALTGTGRYLKERNRITKIVAVEPEGSAVLSTGQSDYSWDSGHRRRIHTRYPRYFDI